jgi:hypothetical protein
MDRWIDSQKRKERTEQIHGHMRLWGGELWRPHSREGKQAQKLEVIVEMLQQRSAIMEGAIWSRVRVRVYSSFRE